MPASQDGAAAKYVPADYKIDELRFIEKSNAKAISLGFVNRVTADVHYLPNGDIDIKRLNTKTTRVAEIFVDISNAAMFAFEATRHPPGVGGLVVKATLTESLDSPPHPATQR